LAFLKSLNFTIVQPDLPGSLLGVNSVRRFYQAAASVRCSENHRAAIRSNPARAYAAREAANATAAHPPTFTMVESCNDRYQTSTRV
jgi:hypothetical protein